MKQGRRLIKSSWAAMLCFLLFIGIGTVSAKYVFDQYIKPALVAKEFYFTSDLLSEEGKRYVLNSGIEEITFDLKNHEDNLRYSEDTLNVSVSLYEITAEGDVLVGGLTEADSQNVQNPLTSSIQGGTVNQLTVTISSQGLQKGKQYRIAATAEAGYTKTLYAVIEISSDTTNLYMNVDNSQKEIVLLTVWTEKLNGTLTMTVPEGLVADESDSDIKASCAGSTCNDTSNFVKDYSSKTYRFFKTNPNIAYKASDFKVFMNQNGVNYYAVESEIK